MTWFVVASSLLTFGGSIDEITGRANPVNALIFTCLFLILACWLIYLSQIWARIKGTAFDSLVMPLFIALMLAYLYSSFWSYLIRPGPTWPTMTVQLFTVDRRGLSDGIKGS